MTNKKILGLAIGQVLVALAMAAGTSHAADIEARVDFESLQGQDRFNRFLVKYAPGSAEAADADRIERGLDAAVARGGFTGARAFAASHQRSLAVPGWHVVETSRKLTKREAEDFLREVAADPAVAHAAAEEMFLLPHTETALAPPNDPLYGSAQWHFHHPVGGVRAEEAWELATGEGVVVAVLDTGIVENHLDLQENVLPGYDFISSRINSHRSQDGRVAGGWDIGDWRPANHCVPLGLAPHPARNSGWHGSHVAGTIAQTTNNSLAYAGLAHGAQVVPVRVLGACGGSVGDIADAIVWASGGDVEGVPANANPAEIINMSLGSGGRTQCSPLYQDAIDQAVDNGSIVVVAAGNSNDRADLYTMSACDKVISVGSTRITGGKASYSSYGGRVDLSAPGGGGNVDGNDGFVWQVINGGAQGPTTQWRGGGKAGTSMASPHVAAVAAMVQGVAETPLDWEQMRDLLVSSARPFPAFVSVDMSMGAGIVDAAAALNAVLGIGKCDDRPASCEPDAEVLTNGVRRTGVSGAEGGESLFEFTAEAGKAISITTLGGTGNVSLYVSHGSVPDSQNHEFSSRRPGNTEIVRIDARQARAGTYYIKLVGESAYSGVLIEARQ